MLQLVDQLRMKGRKAGEMRLRQRLESLLPGSAEALQSNTVCKAKSVAFLIIVAVLWDLQKSAAPSSQATDFSKPWTTWAFGFLSVMQPKADESTAQDSKASQGPQQNGHQHGRIGTWK